MEQGNDLEFNVDDILVGKDRKFSFKTTYTNSFGEKVEGEFISHIPSISEAISIGIIESNQYAGATDRSAIPVDIQNLAFMKATLKVCLVNWPSWFKIEELDDVKLLEAVYVQHTLVTNSFREKSKIAFK